MGAKAVARKRQAVLLADLFEQQARAARKASGDGKFIEESVGSSNFTRSQGRREFLDI